MAKFKPGDKVRSSVDGKTYIAMEESRPGYWWLADLDGRGNGLETREIDLTLANGVRSRNAVVAKALNACARNYAYSHDPIKLMIQYAKKEDYGGIMDFTNPAEADSMGLYPADLVRRIYAKASKYYAGGRNMATPAQTQELVGLISGLRIKGINACGTARNAAENDVKQALAEIKGLTQHVTAIKSKIRALGNKVREITHFQSGLDYKVSSQVSDAYDKLMSDLWEAANAG